MKFLPIFGVMLVLSFTAFFLFAGSLTENIYVWIVLSAFVGALAIWAFAKLSDQIDVLEKRIKELEEKKGE